MNAYQQKWIDTLKRAKMPGWKIEAHEDDIFVDMPYISDLKIIRDNLPFTLGQMALDIDLPKERVQFVFHNGYENFEYILNPDAADLNGKDTKDWKPERYEERNER